MRVFLHNCHEWELVPLVDVKRIQGILHMNVHCNVTCACVGRVA